MDIRNRHGLKAAADASLDAASYDPRKLVFIHTIAAVALSFLVTVLDFILSTQIADTGGLGGVGLRSILSTMQSVLRLANLVILPFWEVGYLHAAMNIARGRPAQPRSLLEGFRRWGVVLRTNLLLSLLYMGIAIASFYLAIQIFMLTPLSSDLYALLSPYIAEGTTQITMDAATAAAMTRAMVPMLILFAVLYTALVTPTAYQYRMVNYALLDDPKAGALAALRRSLEMMRGNRFQLFRLDLGFWWFYAAQGLLSVICYGDMLLPTLGITLPFSDTVSFFLFFILSLVAQVALYTLLRNKVAVTYAHAYDTLRQEPYEEVLPPEPENQPWSYE